MGYLGTIFCAIYESQVLKIWHGGIEMLPELRNIGGYQNAFRQQLESNILKENSFCIQTHFKSKTKRKT